MRKFKQWSTTRQTLTVAGALLALLIVVGALAGGSTDTTDTTSTSAGTTTAAPSKPKSAAKPKPTTAPTTTTIAAAPSKSKPSGDTAVDRNTRRYAEAVQGCRQFAAIVRSAAVKGETDMLDMADLTTTARDGCDNRRSTMLGMDHDHFDDQAQTAWIGVDELKSGLNALLAYIDNPRPGKIIEARDKLNEGDATAREGLRGINQRRHVYGLRALKVG